MSAFAIARQKMVDGQVRASDVTDHRVLDAMLTVPREAFVPAGKEGLAYLDLDLDVASTGGAPRFLVTAMLTSKLLQAAEVKATDSMLVVGCATGYAAALAAKLAATVTATESDQAVQGHASELAAKLALTNVTLKLAAPALGDPAGGKFDVILLNGATEIPLDGLCQQLKNGGRLVGVFAATKPARAMIVTRSHDEFGARVLFDAAAPILPGLERVPEFVF